MTSQRGRWALCVSVFVLASLVAASTATAGRPHAFPRTYHLWGGWVDPPRLAKYDMVVGTSGYDVSYLRSHNRRGIFLLTPGLHTGPGDKLTVGVQYGAADQWNGGRDRVRGGIDLGYIRAFDPAWDYLRNANGSIAQRVVTWGVHGWNLADPTRKGTPNFIAKVFALAAERGGIYRRGWDGVHSDSWAFPVGGRSRWGDNLDTDRDGRVDDPEVLQRNWCNGFARLGTQLRSYFRGKIVGGNGAWWKPWTCADSADPKAWLKTSNYTMIQEIQRWFYDSPGEFIRIAKRWLTYPDPRGQRRYLAVTQNAFDCAGSEFDVPANADPNWPRYMLDPCVMRSMRWGLTLALMGGAYYQIKSVGHSARWWYDEYDGGVGVRRRGYLGAGRERPKKVKPGVYKRKFANGVVVNNSTSSPVTVRFSRAYRHLRGRQNPRLNDGSRARSVTVPGHDGVILLSTR